MATKHSGEGGIKNFGSQLLLKPQKCITNFLFLRDQSIGAVFDYLKGIFYVLFIKNVKMWRPNFYALVTNGDQII